MREPAIQADKVAVYVRWSTEDQAEGTTLEVQREACMHFMLSQGWRYRDELLFVDDGFSGATMERPSLSRLREQCRQGFVDCVVVYKLDRLSRSVVDTVRLVMEEWAGRVSLKSAREPVDTASPMGRQLFYLLTAYAEWERNVIRERTAAGKHKRAREGRNPGFTAPYGYRIAGEGRFGVELAEAPVLQQIFDLAAAGMSAGQIAHLLNQNGIPSRSGRRWSAQVIDKLLRNPACTGLLTYGKGAAEGPVQVAGVFPPLVEQALFERVQRLRQGRRAAVAPVRALAGEALLGGLAVCSRCGESLTACSRLQGRYRYYRCACGFLPREQVDQPVLLQVIALYGVERLAAAIREQLRLQARRDGERLEAALRQARREAILAERATERMHRAFLTGKVDAAQYVGLEHRAGQQLKEAGRRVDRLRQELMLCRRASSIAPRERGEWEWLSVAQQKAVLRALLRRAVLHRDGPVSVELTWAKADEPA